MERELWEVISLFSGDEKESGLFFTLNQDLFMERQFGTVTGRKICNFDVLGLDKRTWFFYNVLEDIEASSIQLLGSTQCRYL